MSIESFGGCVIPLAFVDNPEVIEACRPLAVPAWGGLIDRDRPNKQRLGGLIAPQLPIQACQIRQAHGGFGMTLTPFGFGNSNSFFEGCEGIIIAAYCLVEQAEIIQRSGAVNILTDEGFADRDRRVVLTSFIQPHQLCRIRGLRLAGSHKQRC